MHFSANETSDSLYLKAWDTVKRIQATLSMGDETFSELLELPKNTYQKIKAGQKPVPAKAFAHLSKALNLNVGDIYSGRINYAALDAYFNKNELYISEVYTRGAGSRFWTVQNILTYVEKRYGWHMRLQALRHFQLSERYFSDLNRGINFDFMTELLAYLEYRTMPGAEFVFTGSNLVNIFNKKNLIGDLLQQKKMKSAYEVFFEKTITQIDRNYSYRIEYINDRECVIRMEPDAMVSEELHKRNPGSFNTCTYREGVLAAVPKYLGIGTAKVSQLSCFHKGDSICRFRIQFPRILASFQLRS